MPEPLSVRALALHGCVISAQVGCQNPGRDAHEAQKCHGGRRQTDRAKTVDEIGGWVDRGAAAKRRKAARAVLMRRG